jgi:hypothetical protein
MDDKLRLMTNTFDDRGADDTVVMTVPDDTLDRMKKAHGNPQAF